jgi:hypothetical protein
LFTNAKNKIMKQSFKSGIPDGTIGCDLPVDEEITDYCGTNMG